MSEFTPPDKRWMVCGKGHRYFVTPLEFIISPDGRKGLQVCPTCYETLLAPMTLGDAAPVEVANG